MDFILHLFGAAPALAEDLDGQAQKPMVNSDTVPNEIFFLLFKDLPVQALGNFCCTSKKFKSLIEKERDLPCVLLAKNFFQSMYQLPNEWWSSNSDNAISHSYVGKINDNKSISLSNVITDSYSFMGKRNLIEIQPTHIARPGRMINHRVLDISLTHFDSKMDNKDKMALMVGLDALNIQYKLKNQAVTDGMSPTSCSKKFVPWA